MVVAVVAALLFETVGNRWNSHIVPLSIVHGTDSEVFRLQGAEKGHEEW